MIIEFGSDRGHQHHAISGEVFRGSRTASALPKLNFTFKYASRGDVKELASNIAARGDQLTRIVSDYFSNADVTLEFLGASELISLYRKSRFTLDLAYSEQLSVDQGAFVMLVKLSSYADFVRDEHGNLRRYLFDSNVRDFLGANAVNQDIAQSLSDPTGPDFWWLNNGVTILVTSAIPLGKTPIGSMLRLHDVQIVNGLQTTQTLHNYVASGGNLNDGCVLVKVIVSEDIAVRDQIIRATNNQSSVELASLSATDKIQRDIEAILEQHNWFYERRKNYYKNEGKPKERFVDPQLLSVAMIALARKAPQISGRLKSKFMRDPVSRDAVFSEQLPILLWPKIAAVMKMVDQTLTENRRPRTSNGRRGLASWRGAVALCVVAEVFGTFEYSLTDLVGIDESKITPARILEIFDLMTQTLRPADAGAHFFRQGKIDTQTIELGKRLGLKGIPCVGRWVLPRTSAQKIESSKKLNITLHNAGAGAKAPKIRGHKRPVAPTELLPEDLRLRVHAALPPQPWQPGMQQILAKELSIELKILRRAINELIGLGIVSDQKEGVVIGPDGIIQAVDTSRCDPKFKVGDAYPYIS